MANDVSHFKVANDSTIYNFNDLDAESRIAAETTRAKGVEGTLSNLTTTAKGNLVAAINEVAGRSNGTDMAINQAALQTGQIFTTNNARDYIFLDLYMSCWNAYLPVVRLRPNKQDATHMFGIYAMSGAGVVSEFAVRLTTDGRYFTGVKVIQSQNNGAWTDVSSSSPLSIVKAIGYA